jgi:predicted transcriptional regulator
MMRPMRTTVDLPPAVHRRAVEIAKRTGQSLSAVIAELTVRGLSQLDVPITIATDERSGFPVISVGRRVTSEQVAAALDEE